MAHIGGWNIWGKSKDKLRQFSVGEPSEDAALATLKAHYPDLEVVSRHGLGLDLTQKLGIANNGKVIEWVPLEAKDKLTRAGGVPISQPMKSPKP